MLAIRRDARANRGGIVASQQKAPADDHLQRLELSAWPRDRVALIIEAHLAFGAEAAAPVGKATLIGGQIWMTARSLGSLGTTRTRADSSASAMQAPCAPALLTIPPPIVPGTPAPHSSPASPLPARSLMSLGKLTPRPALSRTCPSGSSSNVGGINLHPRDDAAHAGITEERVGAVADKRQRPASVDGEIHQSLPVLPRV